MLDVYRQSCPSQSSAHTPGPLNTHAPLCPRRLTPNPQLLCQSFQMAGEQDRRILKAAATSKRSKGSGGTAATAAATGAKDAKTFQAGVGGQADAASLLLEGLLLKVGDASISSQSHPLWHSRCALLKGTWPLNSLCTSSVRLLIRLGHLSSGSTQCAGCSLLWPHPRNDDTTPSAPLPLCSRTLRLRRSAGTWCSRAVWRRCKRR